MKILNFYKSSTIQKELKMSYIRTQNAAKTEKLMVFVVVAGGRGKAVDRRVPLEVSYRYIIISSHYIILLLLYNK